MTISIIIPVYNTEIYLKDCLESLINQTYKDLEIICVNDGSKDNSLQILEEYSKKDSRVKIINQENKGMSAARNNGIKNANGEFIAFVDSDDWLDLNYFEKLHKAIAETNSDIAASSIIRTRENSKKIRIKYEKEEIFETLKEKIKANDTPRCCYVWNKLYRADLVKETPFKEGVYYEDVIWTPTILEKSEKMVTVPNTNYYYRANSNSTVKKKQSSKKQSDSYSAKKFLINFFEKHKLPLSKKEKTITKSIKYIGNFQLIKIKEYQNKETGYLFNILPIYKKTIKAPIIKDSTFIVWEPCSISHSEVVPGYCKYLLDLGYHVSVLVTPERYKEGLFSKFEHENLTLNKLTQKEIKKYFKSNSIDNIKGIVITTVGKLCDCIHYKQVYDSFYPNTDKKKILCVEHESSFAIDKDMWEENLITLRKLNYKEAKSVIVNPHYFGNIEITPKNEKITNFITIGTIKPNKKNSQMIINAAQQIYNEGYRNFKITVVGKGNLKHLPKELQSHFDIKGRLPFKKMYEEIEKADFMLTSYNEYDKEHIRYNTTGTSGNFQLVYGFLKPCIITSGFAPMNEFDNTNAILYSGDENYKNALIQGINMNQDEYEQMQENLKNTAEKIYQSSKENLKKLIENNHEFIKN